MSVIDMLREVWTMRYTLQLLVVRDLRARYAGLWAGALWLFIQPLLYLSLLMVATAGRNLTGLEGPATQRALFLLAGLIPWNFMVQSVNLVANYGVSNLELMRKSYLPVPFLVLAPMLVQMVDTGILSLLFLIISSLMIEPNYAMISLFSIPVAMSISAFGIIGYTSITLTLVLRWRDLRHILAFALPATLFICPVLILHDPSVVQYLDPTLLTAQAFRQFIGMAPISVSVTAYLITQLLIFFAGIVALRLMGRSFVDHG